MTWLRDRKEPYNLGDLEYHLAFVTDDYAALHEKHQKMGVVCFENPGMGIYFIHDPMVTGSKSSPKKIDRIESGKGRALH